MVQKETILTSADNSGAKIIKCIYIPKKKIGSMGDRVYVVLQKVDIKKKLIKKKTIFRFNSYNPS